MVERTLSIIKPDAVKRNIIGKINAMLEEAGFKIVAQKMIHMTKEKAQGFYIVHKDRSFYDELTSQMSAYPVIVQVLDVTITRASHEVIFLHGVVDLE